MWLPKCWNVDVIDPLELGRGYIHSLNRSELDLDPRPLRMYISASVEAKIEEGEEE